MCLAVPMKVILAEGELATVEAGGIQRKVGIQLLPDIKVGDYVLVHAGFAIQKIREKEAIETLDILNSMDIIS